jgi:polar amino acid transport system substrate-binding protein
MKIFKNILKTFVIFSPIFSNAYAEKNITFCVDQNIWFPYNMTDNQGNSTGVIIDIARIVSEKLNWKTKFISTPWSRCTSKSSTDSGDYDGIITPSYSKSRSEFLNYPPDAESEPTACSSIYNVVCAEYVFVVAKNSENEDYKFEGDVTSLPEPIRAPRGYSIVNSLNEELTKANKPLVEIGSTDQKNLLKLLRDKDGVVVIDARVAKNLMNNNSKEGKIFQKELKILEKPYISKSNYIAFYKSSKNLTNEEKLKFWTELSILLKNKEEINKIYSNPEYDSKNTEKYDLK